jgi:hypothetical protein
MRVAIWLCVAIAWPCFLLYRSSSVRPWSRQKDMYDIIMTLFSVENSKSVNLVLTPAVLDRTPYRMLGLGTYSVAVSQVLYLTTYDF